MDYDREKVDEMVLALLYLTVAEQGEWGRAGVEVSRLGRAGPVARQGVYLRSEKQSQVGCAQPGGYRRARQLFERHFAR
jgi:hypothetical protein